MPLDAAQFISELSIDDPPGTDPLNQGDDQIRTTKRATQQSFPNVDAAVPQTAAQMAQMAIKNEANTFTQVNTFQDTLLLNDGNAAGPAYRFTNNTNMGMYRAAADDLGFATSGTQRLLIRNNGLENITGTNGAPSYSFSGDNDSGMFRIQANDIGWATGGVRQMRLRGTELELTVPIRGGFGSASAPQYSFDTNENTGMYRVSINVIGFASGGSEKMRVDGFGIKMVDGSAANPAVAFVNNTNMGMYRGGTSILSFATAGVNRFQITTAAIQPFLRTEAIDGTAALPAYTFNSQSNTGMFRVGIDELGFAAGASLQFKVKALTVSMPLLPTSSAGLAAGDLFRTGGNVNIV